MGLEDETVWFWYDPSLDAVLPEEVEPYEVCGLFESEADAYEFLGWYAETYDIGDTRTSNCMPPRSNSKVEDASTRRTATTRVWSSHWSRWTSRRSTPERVTETRKRSSERPGRLSNRLVVGQWCLRSRFPNR